jgi:hypothetical protein
MYRIDSQMLIDGWQEVEQGTGYKLGYVSVAVNLLKCTVHV